MRLGWMVVVGGIVLSGCAKPGRLSHIPPFARAPYQAFSRAALVAVALREWRLFGQPSDKDADNNPTAPSAKPERAEGLWQRVGEYWWLGLNRDSPEAGWTGKHDGMGGIFTPEDDGEFAWSAAFISYAMRIAGAGAAFPYAADHAAYINEAKRMSLGLARGWIVTAERPEAYAPVAGDLICHGRGRAAGLRFDDLPTAALFPSHCDIVVDTTRPGVIAVIGGNIGDAVTMRHVPVTAEGKLACADGVVLDTRQTWFAVLRVRDASPGV